MACVVLSGKTSDGLDVLCKQVLDEWDGADRIFLHRPEMGEACFAEGLRPPALVIWKNRAKVLEQDGKQLERETFGTLLTRLCSLRSSESTNARNMSESEQDNDDHSSYRNAKFKCAKLGCDRLFHHVHVTSKSKNEAFDNDDDQDGESDSDRE